MKSQTQSALAIDARAPDLVVSNARAAERDFTHTLARARAMLRTHGEVTLSGIGNATQRALVLSEVLTSRGDAVVMKVQTSARGALGEDDDEDAWTHGAKVEVTLTRALSANA